MGYKKHIEFSLWSGQTECWWQDLTDAELLQVRLCDLELSLAGSWVERVFRQVQGELRRKGLAALDPKIWISSNWFSPDGFRGFAIPFFLLHPRLALLQEQAVGEAEGANWEWCARLMRHELGHVLENAYPKIPASPLREGLFGSNKQLYPKSYVPRMHAGGFVTHLGAGYAQAHPAEDFAETFAVWLTPGSPWRSRYQGLAREKLLALDVLIRDFVQRYPAKGISRSFEPIGQDKRTLGRYLREENRKQKAFSAEMQNRIVRTGLRKLLQSTKGDSSSATLEALWREEREVIRRRLAVEFTSPNYQVLDGIRELEVGIRRNGDAPVSTAKNGREALYRLARRTYRRYHDTGGYRIPI